MRELVWAAAEGLNPGDREVFELSVRHDLPAPEVSALLRVSIAHAHARLSRARAQLERSLAALLVARTGQRDCPKLAGLLGGWDGRLTALLRKRISRHIEECETCAQQQRRQLRPAALFSGYAAAPWLIAPSPLWPRLVRTCSHPDSAQLREMLAARAGPAGSDGFPRPRGALRRRRALLAGSSAVAVASLLTAAGLWPLLAVEADHSVTAPAETSTGALVPPIATAEPAPTGPAVDPLPGGSPTVGAPAPVPPPPLAPPPVSPSVTPSPTGSAPTFTATAEATVECAALGQRGGYQLTVLARASAPLGRAVLTVSAGRAPPTHSAMTIRGPTATGEAVASAGPVTWTVAVVGLDGRAAQTEPVTATLPTCPPPAR